MNLADEPDLKIWHTTALKEVYWLSVAKLSEESNDVAIFLFLVYKETCHLGNCCTYFQQLL